MSLYIDYRVLDAGWAECTVQCADVTCEISASYLSDALGNLVIAAAAILAGAHSISVGFDEEPGEYRWALKWSESNQLDLRVLEFETLWGNSADSEGKQLLQATLHPLDFGEAVSSAAARVLSQLGVKGYKEKWGRHEFPSLQLKLLDCYIDSWRNNAG